MFNGRPATDYYGNTSWSKSLSAMFPTVFAHFLSLCHIWIILIIFQTLSLSLYLLWRSVISDFWCYCCNCFRASQTAYITHRTLTDKCVCSDCLTHLSFPVSLPSGLCSPWDKTILKLSQLLIYNGLEVFKWKVTCFTL